MNEIVQLKITLEGSDPPIWRRALVSTKTDFYDLHLILQILMGWENSHPYSFTIGNTAIGEFDEFEPTGDQDYINSWEIRIENVLKKVGDELIYVYDFGDNWRHIITVEKFLPRDSKMNYPKCIDGKMKTPLEDCGGIHAHYYLLEVLADEQHPDYEDMSDWAECGFDVDEFDIDFINSRL